MKYSYKTIK